MIRIHWHNTDATFHVNHVPAPLAVFHMRGGWRTWSCFRGPVDVCGLTSNPSERL